MRARLPGERAGSTLLGLACGLAFTAYMALFFPGYITPDTILTLRMGIGTAVQSDWHPPLLGAVWGALHAVFQNIAFVWMAQILLFIGAAASWARWLAPSPLAPLALAVLVLWPPVMTNMAAIWKDCWTIVATLAAVAFARDALASGRLAPIALSIGAAVAAVVFRLDYLPVVVPFVLFAGALLARERRLRHPVHGMGIALAAFLAGLVVLGAVSGRMVVRDLNPWLTVAVWDIAGARLQAEPAASGVEIAGGHFPRDLYTCRTSDPLVFGAGNGRFNLPETALMRPVAEEARDLAGTWLRTVSSHPVGYLRHRACVLRSFLGVDGVHYPYPFGISPPSEFGGEFVRNRHNIAAYFFFDRHAHGVLWRYWAYLAVATLLAIALLAGWRSRTGGPHGWFMAALAASVFAAAGRGLILPAADFRYGLWIAVGTLVLVFEMLGRRPDAQRPASSPAEVTP